MNITIMDKDFSPIGIISSLQTLIWDRRAGTPGMFEVHAGPADFGTMREGSYVYRSDRDELGVILSVGAKVNKANEQTCYIKGYFAECLLNDRVADTVQKLTGTPEEIARDLVDAYFVAPSRTYPGRRVDFIRLGDTSGIAQETTSVSVTGKAIGDFLYDLEAAQGLSHRLRYDSELDALYFEVYKPGLAADDENPVVFSDNLRNISKGTYKLDKSDSPNVIFISGNGEGTSRRVAFLDLRANDTQYARELFVDARDLQQNWTDEDGSTKSYSDEDYDQLLLSRGRQKAESHKAAENITVKVSTSTFPRYREDYDVGDLCIVKLHIHGDTDIEMERVITSARESYETGAMQLELTFGDPETQSLKSYVARVQSANESPVAPTSNIGDLAMLSTETKTGVVPAINEIKSNTGDLSELKTKDRSSIVKAINELSDGGGEKSTTILVKIPYGFSSDGIEGDRKDYRPILTYVICDDTAAKGLASYGPKNSTTTPGNFIQTHSVLVPDPITINDYGSAASFFVPLHICGQQTISLNGYSWYIFPRHPDRSGSLATKYGLEIVAQARAAWNWLNEADRKIENYYLRIYSTYPYAVAPVLFSRSPTLPPIEDTNEFAELTMGITKPGVVIFAGKVYNYTDKTVINMSDLRIKDPTVPKGAYWAFDT